ncbi:MAG: glutamate-1-semialdehyde 2,1-aminomutase [Phycisphaerae bacterium]|nr:glutamate-1-semialdehyde 2,1-aminomutase [Gemmatimonadaceae bacterium]
MSRHTSAIDPVVERTLTRSEQLFATAQKLMPGGVSSPVRAFRSVGGTPRFIARGSGASLVDVDGNSYIDYVLSWGPLILGHAHPAVVAAITDQAGRGATFGAPSELESELASMITQIMPAIEMVRFVSSGTEAAMSAVRLARAVTGRTKVVKFAGCYHGHADPFLVQAGSGVATLGLPDSPGVAANVVADTLSAPFNDASAVEALCASKQVAAVLVEPVAGNMGLVLPKPEFLQALRDICTRTGTLLVFDEVMTGFRVALGGAQALYGIQPDLTCLGKVIGGGLPAAAYGGKREYMMRIAPAGPVYQAGTLSGNPLAMAAGIATLREISKPGVFESMSRMTGALTNALERHATLADIPLVTSAIGSMWGFFFAPEPIHNYAEATLLINKVHFGTFFHAMLNEGVYLAPSAFESAFVSVLHDEETLAATDQAMGNAMQVVREVSR